MAGRRIVIGALGVGLLVLSGCGLASARNTFNDDATVDAKITSVRVANDSGDVTIRVGDRTTVHRGVHYDRERPGVTHHVEGSTLVIDSCKPRNCWIDYEVSVPRGTTVSGAADSGRGGLDGGAPVNLKASSGDGTARGVSREGHVGADSGSVHPAD